MRLHHLTIQAFGPFGGTVEIDFDELNDAGQFLISGATGSGKTSILDAVCFALYGEVPGERQRAKHLRSDHAVADAEPRVTLTLTIAERAVRISRTPAWERPKRRGTGLTPQQASVRLEQQIDGDWQCLATRLDEAGHLINTWLGMTPVQFTQVALLPQGGFQTFLQSPTAARQAVLQRLFRTDRFDRVERWFGDFRRSLNRSRAEALHGIDVIVHRLAEAAGALEPPATSEDIDVVVGWAESQRKDADAAHQSATAHRDQAVGVHATAAHHLDEAIELATVLDRVEAARRELAHLEESAPAFEEEIRALRAHEHAESLAPLIKVTAEAAAAADRAELIATTKLREAGVPLDDRADLETIALHVREDVQRAGRAQSLADKLNALQAEKKSADTAWRATTAALTEMRAVTDALPREQKSVAEKLQVAVNAQVDLASSAVELDLAQQRLGAARELEHLSRDLADKEALRRTAHDRVQDLRQEYQDAREARIEAMASELAVGLVVGCSCPVCGSTSHPSPAASAGGVGRRIEERARKRYETAGVELTALDDVIAAARARADALRQTARDIERSAWEKSVHDLQTQHAAWASRAALAEPLREQAAALEERLVQTKAELDRLVQAEAQAHAQTTLLTTQVDEIDLELQVALGDHADASSYAEHARARDAAVKAALAAERSRLEAHTAAAQQRATLDLQAVSLGFTSGLAAESALLDEERATDIAQREQTRAQARSAAASVLDDPRVIESLQFSRPVLEPLRAEAARAEAALTTAQTQVQVMATRRERTTVIAQELDSAIRRYRPLEAKAERVSALSGLLEGTGADNRLRMRLSAFVLAERLRQVIDAANVRLEVISEGRYVLTYQEERGAGDSRGGLSFSVLDEWTGVRRDPSTLSGGETFVVSLCLALGLADTVADESGGLRIDTLFIDEGFGSLDAQTLDSVIDILSQLSQGGRVTGVVSHVFELRERLPAVLEVVPSKSGSTVRRATA